MFFIVEITYFSDALVSKEERLILLIKKVWVQVWRSQYMQCTTTTINFIVIYVIYKGIGQYFQHQSSTFYLLLHIYLIQPTLSYPSPPPDSMSSLVFYLAHHPPPTTYFSSPSHHHLSVTHLNWFILTTSVTCSISILSLSSTLGILSLWDTSHIHCSIFISVPSNRSLQSLWKSHYHTPTPQPLSVHVTYTFPFNFNDTIPDGPLNFPHAQYTLTTDAGFSPPLSTSLREHNFPTLHIGC